MKNSKKRNIKHNSSIFVSYQTTINISPYDLRRRKVKDVVSTKIYSSYELDSSISSIFNLQSKKCRRKNLHN